MKYLGVKENGFIMTHKKIALSLFTFHSLALPPRVMELQHGHLEAINGCKRANLTYRSVFTIRVCQFYREEPELKVNSGS